MPSIQLKKLHPDAIVPSYQHADDSALDLHAVTDLTLLPGQSTLVPTGFAIAIPPNTEAQVRPRSGLALKHQITVLNTPGTVDEGYRGEIGVILINHGTQAFSIQKGDRIAQLVIAPILRVDVDVVSELPPTQRSREGFGSTGI
ncbi:MAG: dUTP diphosphatase [Cyanobacteria bacterium P01_H01_bin.15]